MNVIIMKPAEEPVGKNSTSHSHLASARWSRAVGATEPF